MDSIRDGPLWYKTGRGPILPAQFLLLLSVRMTAYFPDLESIKTNLPLSTHEHAARTRILFLDGMFASFAPSFFRQLWLSRISFSLHFPPRGLEIDVPYRSCTPGHGSTTTPDPRTRNTPASAASSHYYSLTCGVGFPKHLVYHFLPCARHRFLIHTIARHRNRPLWALPATTGAGDGGDGAAGLAEALREMRQGGRERGNPLNFMRYHPQFDQVRRCACEVGSPRGAGGPLVRYCSVGHMRVTAPVPTFSCSFV